MQSIDGDTEIRLNLTLRSRHPKPNSAGPSQTLSATLPEVPAGGIDPDGRKTERSHTKRRTRRCNGIQMGSLEMRGKQEEYTESVMNVRLIGYLKRKVGSDVYENQAHVG